MASYNNSFNKDDSIVRHIIIGLLADLNNKLYFWRQVDEKTRSQIDIPFYYSITGDDQFLRDQFLFSTASGPNCFPDVGFADGNYDVVPRGIANLTSLAIDSGKLVNKRTMGTYTRMDDTGAMQGYVAEFEMIPINVGIDIEILVSSTLDSFKITEAIIKTLYKSNYFNVEVGHLEEGTYRLSSYYQIPDDFDIQRPLEFTYDDKETYKITFPIEINSFIPSFDNGFHGTGINTERHVGNRMFEISSNTVTIVNDEVSTIDTIKVDSKGLAASEAPALSGTYDINGLHLPGVTSQQESSIYTQFIDVNLVEVEPLFINASDAYNDLILVAINGSINIDTSNFANVATIVINEGGSLTLKYYGSAWYVIANTNAIVTYQ